MPNAFTRNKYNNQKTAYKGRIFASKKEALHAQDLELQRLAQNPRQKVVAVIEQYRMPLNAPGGSLVGYYVADFFVSFADGHKEIQDVKGFKTDLYKWKKRHVEAQYGEKIIEF